MPKPRDYTPNFMVEALGHATTDTEADRAWARNNYNDLWIRYPNLWVSLWREQVECTAPTANDLIHEMAMRHSVWNISIVSFQVTDPAVGIPTQLVERADHQNGQTELI